MAFYKDLKRYPQGEAEPGQAGWIAKRLLRLRRELRERIVDRRRPDSLIVGSWNIRAFDGGRLRLDESYHYIAEIIDHFDIVAVQEIRSDLAPLRRLVTLLGPNWDYFVTDITAGDRGNDERMAFLFDRNRVFFRNLIGEVVLPEDQLLGTRQFARTPFFASFQAGWFRFTLCSAHIVYGGDAEEGRTLRAEEVRAISRVLADRARSEGEVYILIGDMNIESPDDAIMSALRSEGLDAPLFGPTNLSGTRHFDQIAFTGERTRTHLLGHGAFDWRPAVFGPEDRAAYQAPAEVARGEPFADWDRSYPGWTTHEMSDHLPIWVELEVDYSDAYLGRFVPEAG